jgi:DNA-damage-inducible protein D
MKKELITKLHRSFEEYAHSEDGVEFWYARDLQQLLQYTDWRNFLLVVDKAKKACENSNVERLDHFVDVNKMIGIGKGAEREIADLKLTRYACYLIAQNGDPRKPEIAFAQTYFAVQTRKAEIIEQRLSELRRIEEREKLTETEKRFAGIAFERNVDSRGFARIKSRGDSALFGGITTQGMKKRLDVPGRRALADFLPTVTITGKAFANALTEQNVVGKNLRGERPIGHEHEESNKAVRKAMIERGVRPETLPPAEDIKKITSRVKAETKTLPKHTKKITKKGKK